MDVEIHATKWHNMAIHRVFKTRHFQRWLRKAGLADRVLCSAVSEMMRGLVDADLGGNVLKKRVAIDGCGRSHKGRVIIGDLP